jgi:hypothetical protein
MALYSVRTGATTLTGGATKSLILLNPVTDKFDIVSFSVSMDASASSTGVAIELYRVTTIGSPAGASTTPNPVDARDAAATTTSLTVLSTEPTTVLVLDDWYIQPFGGLLYVQYPLGREMPVAPAGARVGFRYVTPASVTPNCRATCWISE